MSGSAARRSKPSRGPKAPGRPRGRRRVALGSPSAALPALVRHVSAALRTEGQPGAAAALDAFARAADGALLRQGVLLRDRDYPAIEAIARRHLGLGPIQRARRRALDALQPFAAQEALERAMVHYQTISDEAYWLCGLAMGLVAAGRYRER